MDKYNCTEIEKKINQIYRIVSEVYRQQIDTIYYKTDIGIYTIYTVFRGDLTNADINFCSVQYL